MIREAKEEVDIILEPDDLEVAHITHKKKEVGDDSERVDIFLTTDRYKGELKNMEPNKCDDLKWSSINNLPENMVSYVKHSLEQIEENKFYSELGF